MSQKIYIALLGCFSAIISIFSIFDWSYPSIYLPIILVFGLNWLNFFWLYLWQKNIYKTYSLVLLILPITYLLYLYMPTVFGNLKTSNIPVYQQIIHYSGALSFIGGQSLVSIINIFYVFKKND